MGRSVSALVFVPARVRFARLAEGDSSGPKRGSRGALAIAVRLVASLSKAATGIAVTARSKAIVASNTSAAVRAVVASVVQGEDSEYLAHESGNQEDDGG
jgi:hypothetical protein